MAVRRAFVWASLGQYLVISINLANTIVMARLVKPSDFGAAAIGTAIFAIAEAIRSLSGTTYLIQHRDLQSHTVRTSFTLNLVITCLLAALIVLSANRLALLLQAPALAEYLRVAALGYLTGPFVYPIWALLSRNMTFGVVAFVLATMALVNAVTSIALAQRGFGSLSFAWASAASTVAAVVIYHASWRDWSIFRPSFRDWRRIVAFGMSDGTAATITQVAESLPYLILGRLLGTDAMGLGQRAALLCLFPERVILSGVRAVALPAFSRTVHEGKDVRSEYLRAIELISAVQWPALILLFVLADPIVAVLLGPQWHNAIPIVEILAISLLFSFPLVLHYPVLVAVGAIRFIPPVLAGQAIFSIALLSFAATRGLQTAALSMLLIVPINSLISLGLVRRFIRFSWISFGSAVKKSAGCALASAAGPIAVGIGDGWPNHVSIGMGIAALALSGIGWLFGLWLTRHPLLGEIRRAAVALRGHPIATKLLRRPTAISCVDTDGA